MVVPELSVSDEVQVTVAPLASGAMADASPPPTVLLERAGHVARLVINRPERRNALSGALIEALILAFAAVDADAMERDFRASLTPSEWGLVRVTLAPPLAFAVCAVVGVVVWRRRHVLDGLLLGRDMATSIGIDHRRELTVMLIIVAALVSFSTALVGPLTFFGFLVATVAYQVAGTHRHSHVLPMAVLLGVIALAGGQFILQHLFYASGFLTVIIEFAGGIVFLAILIGGRKL